MKQIDNINSYFNVYNRNAETIKSIEKKLFELINEIHVNKYFLRMNKSNPELIKRKWQLELDYQKLSELYCNADPFSHKEIVIN